MPTSDQHLAQAAHNEGLLALLRQQARHLEYGDWYVTVAFYTAIHHIEDMLYVIKPKTRGSIIKHSSDVRKIFPYMSDHSARGWLLKCGFHNLYDPYTDIYQLSQTAKYNCHSPSESDWSRTVSLLENIKAECKIICETLPHN